MTRGFIEDDKTKLVWNLPRMLLPKNRVKLLLNMLIIASQTIPRGGTLIVNSIGDGGNIVVETGAQGPFVVDTGSGRLSARVIEAIRRLSPKPIQFIANTSFLPDRTGGFADVPVQRTV